MIKVQPVPHQTLAETAAGKLTASLLDGSLQPGAQLPPERELMNQLGISRATALSRGSARSACDSIA